MITPELISFIKAQLAAGKSKDEITATLVPHGWASADIAEAFNEVLPAPAPAPVQPVQPVQSQPVMQPVQPVQPMMQQPTIQQPMQQPAPQMAQSRTTYSQPMMQPPHHSFKNPSGWSAFLAFVVTLIVSGIGLTYSLAAHVKVLPIAVSGNMITLGLLVISGVSILISAAILLLSTKILGIINRSFAKAVVFSSIIALCSIVLTLLHVPALSILLIPIWFVLFCVYYEVGFMKALGAFLLNIAMGLVIGGIIVFAGIAGLKSYVAHSTSYMTEHAGMTMEPSSGNQVALAAQNAATDAATQSMLSNVAAQATAYASSHKNSYGTSAVETFCTNPTQGIQVASANSHGPLLICTVATKFPSKTYTVIAQSMVTPGTYFCIDSTGATVSSIGSLTGNTTYVPGVKCQ